jgi:hypothetical protein
MYEAQLEMIQKLKAKTLIFINMKIEKIKSVHSIRAAMRLRRARRKTFSGGRRVYFICETCLILKYNFT